jgi:RNA polymerase sigma-70 factor (ECF subfamily)
MDTTRASLLLRIRERDNSQAWSEFVRLYRPILLTYARARGLAQHDAEDVAQHCLALIYRKIDRFDYDPRRGRFRSWLRRMVNNRVSNVLARRREITDRADALDLQGREASPVETWDRIWLTEHLRFCCERVRRRVQPSTYEAFRRVAVEGQTVHDVCHALALTPNQVYLAKCRVTQHLRELMTELYGDQIA